MSDENKHDDLDDLEAPGTGPESPHAFVQRRMRELRKEKEDKEKEEKKSGGN